MYIVVDMLHCDTGRAPSNMSSIKRGSHRLTSHRAMPLPKLMPRLPQQLSGSPLTVPASSRLPKQRHQGGGEVSRMEQTVPGLVNLAEHKFQ